MAETAQKSECSWRATYTPEDRKGLSLLENWMREKGFRVYYDNVGNLFGHIAGKHPEVILTGSHRDTVKDGGKYDGVLGVLSSLEAVASLVSELGQPEKSIEVVALCEEEGSRFMSGYIGSKAITGNLNLKEEDESGIQLATALEENGYSGVIAPPRTDIQRFVELHIEQGGVLESQEKQIGIVTAICGLLIGKLKIVGQQNHAGTTPMDLRVDPVVKGAGIITHLTKWAEAQENRMVCTFGNITVCPGNSNVIAESAEISFDIRSEDEKLLGEAKEILQNKLSEDSRFSYSTEILSEDPPTKMDADGVAALEEIATRSDITHLKMVSGAGHDSQIFAPMIKTNMIFVPSEKGISHSPDEYTSEDDICAGYFVLKNYLKELAW